MKNAVTPHCTSLGLGLVEELVFLKVNLSLLEFPKVYLQKE